MEQPQQEIFLDIACFLKGEEKDFVVDILTSIYCYEPHYDIKRLIDKSLIAVSKDGKLWMHDLIQQMGQKSERSRLLCYEDAPQALIVNKVSSSGLLFPSFHLADSEFYFFFFYFVFFNV